MENREIRIIPVLVLYCCVINYHKLNFMHLKPIFWEGTHRLHQTAQDLSQEKVKSPWGIFWSVLNTSVLKPLPWIRPCSVSPTPLQMLYLLLSLDHTPAAQHLLPINPFLAGSRSSFRSQLWCHPHQEDFPSPATCSSFLDFSHLVPCSSISGSLYPS